MQTIEFANIKTKAYNRKSSEQDERQALSVESQIEEAKRMADEHGVTLNEEDILKESRSAKKSYTRPVFEQLINDIENGKVQGIICWHPDRLSRNAGDAGRLVDLFDEEKLKFIITKQQVFKNTPSDKFFFSLMCSQAKMENDNKGINVMRGLVKKRRLGHWPGGAKVGYMNDKGEKGFRTVLNDPERIDLVHQIFQMYLSGKYTAGELYQITIDRLGLTTRPRKREGGTPIKRSQFYKMLKDPYYAGFFYGKDEDGKVIRYEVDPSVRRLITENEHKKILAMLRRGGSPKSWVYTTEFPYKRYAKCGHCGGSITAERKLQLICGHCKHKFSLLNKTECPKCHTSIGSSKKHKRLEYIYYHCCLKKDPSCPGGSVSESQIFSQIQREIIEPLAISPALKKWCLSSIRELEQTEYRKGREVNDNWYRRLEELERQNVRAVEGYSKGLIGDKELADIRIAVEDEKSRIKAKIGAPEDAELDLRQLDRGLDILTEIENIFENGTFEEKIEAMSVLGSNLTIEAKNVTVTKDILYQSIQKGLMEAKAKNPRFEPKNIEDTSGQNRDFSDVRPTLLRDQGSNLGPTP